MSATYHVSIQKSVNMPDKSQNIIKRDLKDLKSHPSNIKIYGDEPVDLDLMESIRERGLKENLVIKPDGT